MNETAVTLQPPQREAVSSTGMSSWQRISFTLARLAIVPITALVGLGSLYRFGRVFGTIEWLINFKRRRRFARACRRLLGADLPQKACRKATREFFCRSRCDKLFYLILDSIKPEKARSLFLITNRADLDAALAKGCGVYLAMSHHGPHHVAAMLLALSGYRVALVRDRREGGIRKYVQDRLNQSGDKIQQMRVLFSDSYPRDIYRCLQDGYILGSAMDVSRVRTPNQKTEEVEIFKETRSFLSGPLRVAMRCKATAFQAFIVPEKNFHYRLELVAKLTDDKSHLNPNAVVAKTMRAYAANVEAYIRSTPSLLSRI